MAASLLIFANKQDVPGALTVPQIAEVRSPSLQPPTSCGISAGCLHIRHDVERDKSAYQRFNHIHCAASPCCHFKTWLVIRVTVSTFETLPLSSIGLRRSRCICTYEQSASLYGDNIWRPAGRCCGCRTSQTAMRTLKPAVQSALPASGTAWTG